MFRNFFGSGSGSRGGGGDAGDDVPEPGPEPLLARNDESQFGSVTGGLEAGLGLVSSSASSDTSSPTNYHDTSETEAVEVEEEGGDTGVGVVEGLAAQPEVSARCEIFSTAAVAVVLEVLVRFC